MKHEFTSRGFSPVYTLSSGSFPMTGSTTKTQSHPGGVILAALCVSSLLILEPAWASADAHKPLAVEATIEMRRTDLIDSRGDGVSPRKYPLTVAASIENTRLLNPTDPVSFSPDGARYLIMVARDDLQNNGSWLELITGRTDTLETAANAQVAARLFTKSRQNNMGLRPSLHPVVLARLKWLSDGESIAFLWSDGEQPTQVIVANLRTGAIKAITSHETSVADFTLLDESGAMVYLAYPKGNSHDASKRLYNSGFAVAGQSIYPYLEGNLDGVHSYDKKEIYISDIEGGEPRRVSCHVTLRCGWFRSGFLLAPDGRYAVLTPSSSVLPKEWERYTDQTFANAFKLALADPENFDVSAPIETVALLDIERAEVRPLWNVPHYWGSTPTLNWSPDSTRILVGPTFLPAETVNPAGLAGLAFAEVDRKTGRVTPIPLPERLVGKGSFNRWINNKSIELRSSEQCLRYRKESGNWHLRQTVCDSTESVNGVRKSGIEVRVRQGLNEFPVVYAIDSLSGMEKAFLELNPGMSRYTLGYVEPVEWEVSGKTWKGRLNYPVNFVAGRRYPLVIQFDSSGADTFSLAGDDHGNPYSSQAMANRGMAVLSVPRRQESEGAVDMSREAEAFMKGVEAAIDELVAIGLADRDKVGIVGFSRTGWYVEFMIAHSDYSIGAAVAADNVDYSYIQAATGFGWGPFTKANGGEAFGDGLLAWFKSAAGFNAHRVRTPLRMEVAQGGIAGLLQYWEMYSRLRYLGTPVELAVVPEAEYASHPLQMPAQKHFSQEGTVDWMDFWLNGREDPDPRKVEQYQRWRKLRR